MSSMGSSPVGQLQGIGEKISEQLAACNVRTIEELANAKSYNLIGVRGAASLIAKAQKAVASGEGVKSGVVAVSKTTSGGGSGGEDANKQRMVKWIKSPGMEQSPVEMVPPTEPETKQAMVDLTGTMQKLTLESKHETNVPALPKEEVFPLTIIDGHSWTDKVVKIPDPLSRKLAFKQAVILELEVASVHNCARVAFLCEWVDDKSNTDKLISFTYSPQLVYTFNTGLPKLMIPVPEDARPEIIRVIESTIVECEWLRQHFVPRVDDLLQ